MHKLGLIITRIGLNVSCALCLFLTMQFGMQLISNICELINDSNLNRVREFSVENVLFSYFSYMYFVYVSSNFLPACCIDSSTLSLLPW